MRVTYKSLHKLEYPVYKLPEGSWEFVDGLLFFDNLLLDDRNMEGETLGVRRLQTNQRNLLPLKRAAVDQLTLMHNPQGNYIDSKGRMFFYEKTKFCKLKYHKIKRLDRKITETVIWLHGVSSPFSVLRAPSTKYTWAGVLYKDGFPWLLYDYAEKREKTRRKKV